MVPVLQIEISMALPLNVLKTKMPENKLSGIFNFNPSQRFLLDCGAGGSRTLVQTCNNITFYMLSFHLDFRLLAGRKLPTHSLASLKFHRHIKALWQLGLLLRSHYTKCRKPRPLSDFLLPTLSD
jgi:hypothetical protein